MKRQLYLNDKDTERFYEILNQKKQLIIKALYKVHIPAKLHHEFYNYGLEGLLISFLILNEGKISEQDFDRFAFTTIKRKLIDEIKVYLWIFLIIIFLTQQTTVTNICIYNYSNMFKKL